MKPVVFLVANSQSSIHIQKLAVTFLVQKCFALHYRVQTFVLLAPVQSQIKSPTIWLLFIQNLILPPTARRFVLVHKLELICTSTPPPPRPKLATCSDNHIYPRLMAAMVFGED